MSLAYQQELLQAVVHRSLPAVTHYWQLNTRLRKTIRLGHYWNDWQKRYSLCISFLPQADTMQQRSPARPEKMAAALSSSAQPQPGPPSWPEPGPSSQPMERCSPTPEDATRPMGIFHSIRQVRKNQSGGTGRTTLLVEVMKLNKEVWWNIDNTDDRSYQRVQEKPETIDMSQKTMVKMEMTKGPWQRKICAFWCESSLRRDTIHQHLPGPHWTNVSAVIKHKRNRFITRRWGMKIL